MLNLYQLTKQLTSGDGCWCQECEEEKKRHLAHCLINSFLAIFQSKTNEKKNIFPERSVTCEKCWQFNGYFNAHEIHSMAWPGLLWQKIK